MSPRSVIGLQPQNDEAWRNMGESRRRLGRTGEGDRALASAFAEFQTTTDLQDRTHILIDLVAINDPRLDDAFARS